MNSDKKIFEISPNNIVKSFILRLFFSIVFLSALISFFIYFYQQSTFYNTIADNIEFYVNKELRENKINDKIFDKQVVKEDISTFIQTLNFVYINIYNKKRELVFNLISKEKKDKYKIIQNNPSLFKSYSKYIGKEMGYNFIKVDDKNYFIQIYYPVYKDNMLLGFIEGVSLVNLNMVKHFETIKNTTILIVILAILLFALIIFPLIYIAYKQLSKNRVELLKSNLQILNALGNAVALRDSDTNEHNYRVTIYSVNLAQKLALDKNEIKKLIKGAFLHDVGKIGISDNILLKKNKLSLEEFEIMKGHVLKGIEIIKNNAWLEDSKDVILYHHERYNGSGYPRGAKKEEIPMVARVFSIIDVFDALTSKRPYKEAFSYNDSIEILKKYSGTYFEPEILKEFLEISSDLYNEVNIQSSEELKKELSKIIKKYFFNS
ncbi:HD-GYP domain-containing protein [Halarcobacter anaerophilus]|uniref:Phosphohydrolase n=1 Tax=Halarcobacter anaerophilus TaxID=877500 RepID=A0A4Q0Y0J8_9BACT|nr:HD-GYP domain-containing protein [Halarcobacter anaerophilus]QDF28906.1 HD superfamily phosphohydrolase [Halarcobacter anaerophilus]RXJ63546.1 phosphohydrolase [Halarcobacter anaerophilus]